MGSWLLLAACRVTEPDDGDASLAHDRDGDGVSDLEDCGPDDESVYAGAPDVCDGLDNDCDDAVDEDVTVFTWYRDQDGDAFGDPAQSVVQCVAPATWVQDGTDCGPSDATVYPGAPEQCDGLDHDCDGEVHDADAVDPFVWYPDDDGDGFGSPEPVVRACEPPPGHVGNADDCDDGRADVSPRGAEVCDDDDADEDCDGAPDEHDDWWANGSAFYPDFDHDGFGDFAAVPVWRCDAPFAHTDNAEDCDDAVRAVNPSATEVCNAVDDDCDGEVDDAAEAPLWYADADEDGWGDEAESASACDAPDGYVATGGDCNDHNDFIHPGATESDCDGVTDYNCDGSFGAADLDGDGFDACEECDDGDPAVFPDATEVCNGADDDCDGALDEAAADAVVFHVDADGDGFGDVSRTTPACEESAGVVADATDCDDADAAVHPSAVEDCATAADDDCDGSPDDEWAYGCLAWYADADGDAFGDASTCRCAATADFPLATGGDCDDTDAEVHPGAPELCANGIDEDCTGADDACTLAAADAVLEGDAAGDETGYVLAVAGDVDGDGDGDLLVGAPARLGTGPRAGAVYVVLGPLAGTLDLPVAAAIVTGGSGDRLGEAAAGVEDADGDGLADIVVGAPDTDTAASAGGSASLLLGPFSGTISSGAAVAIVYGTESYEHAGAALAWTGDADANGLADLLLGAPGNDTGGLEAGAAYVFDAFPSGATAVDAADAVVLGETSDRLGASVAAGQDLDGDGVDDFVLGAPGSGEGAAYVFLGPVGGGLTTADADAAFSGEAAGDEAGSVVALGGDTDADGLYDLFVGAPACDAAAVDAGCAYVVAGPVSRSAALSSSLVVLRGGAAGDGFGTGLAGGLDRDSDGRVEILAGAPGYDDASLDVGRLHLFYGGISGTVVASDADVDWTGLSAGAGFGTSVLAPGDLDGDGSGDVVGAGPAATDSTGAAAGVAWLL